MIRLLSISLFISFSTCFGQAGFKFLSYDFGELYKGDKRYVDFSYKNTTGKKTFLLSVKNDRRTRILTSSNTVLPDSTIIIRIKYNPQKKGKFNITIPVYFSHLMEPHSLVIKGNVKEVDNSDGLDCPSFENKDIEQELSTPMIVKVLDKETLAPIDDAEIKLISRGLVFEKLKTNKKGKAETKLRIGLYYFVTDASNYNTNEEDHIITKRNNEITILLERDKRIEEIQTDTLLVTQEDIIIDDNINSLDTLATKKETYFAPNNIVFLLDISSSMNQKGKLDLLKSSMIELANELRDVDKITLVAYSTFSKVLLKTTTGSNKEEIIETIQDLKASGMTAGGEGMKLAYRLAKKNFIKDGNNQVIMATDGDFNRGATSIDRLVKKNTSKGIKLSVLGIKNKEIHALDMKEISALGNGNYVYIDSYNISKTALINEIREQSLREKH